MPAVEATGLVKRFRIANKRPGLAGALRHLVAPRYEDKLAVDHVDLTIERGEHIAYLGPNGAGKSTTIKMLTGIVAPTEGEVRVCGLVPRKSRIEHARNIGVVFGQRSQLWWDLPVRDSFRLLGDIYGLSPATFKKNLDHAIEELDLGELLRLPARGLSLGQRTRCDLAASMLHRPAVLFLDEPTIGLDLNVKESIRAFIRNVAAENSTTILLTSHDLDDIEGICERIVVIDRGKKLFDDRLSELVRRFARDRVLHIHLADTSDAASAALTESFSSLRLVKVEALGAGHVRVQFDPEVTPAGRVLSHVLGGTEVRDVRLEQQGIQDVVRRVYRGRTDAEDEA